MNDIFYFFLGTGLILFRLDIEEWTNFSLICENKTVLNS